MKNWNLIKNWKIIREINSHYWQSWFHENFVKTESVWKSRKFTLTLFFAEISWKQYIYYVTHSVEKYSKTLSQFFEKKMQIFRQIEANLILMPFY